jgi:hypothetical protein
MAVKESQRDRETLWDRITRGLVVDVATAIAILYGVGLIIVNLDLGRYGVAAVDLARPEYVMVGLLWAFLESLTTVMILIMIWCVRLATAPFEYFLTSALAFVFFLTYLVMLAIVCGVTDPLTVFDPWFLKLVISLLVQGAGIVYSAWILNSQAIPVLWGDQRLVLAPHESSDPHPSVEMAIYLAMGTPIITGLVCLVIYTTIVFPQIPREWGGGMKPVVELFLTEKVPIFSDHKGIASTMDGRRVGPVICILETDRMVVVAPLSHSKELSEQFETIAIDRKVVAGILYEGFSSGVGRTTGRYWHSISSSSLTASPTSTPSPPIHS